VETSIREVARRAGVSVGTVSNVLNRPSRVAATTRARVLAAIDDLGFVRNESARQLRVGRSQTLGLIVPDTRNPFFTDIARGVEDAAAGVGLGVLLCNSAASPGRERRALDLLEQQRVRGLLIAPVGLRHDHLARLQGRGMGVVLLDRRAPHHDCCSVRVDHEMGGDIAVSHLIGLGHKRFAYASGPLDGDACQGRHRGALRALDRAGLPPEALINLVQPELSVSSGRNVAATLLRLDPRPTALFCGNDLMAVGALHALLRAGVRVPDDIAIVGYDDVELADAAAIPLTTVRQPRQQLGHVATELVIEEAGEAPGHRHRHVPLAPELITRDST
jgi:LacI family transcriptional regulator